MQMPSPTLKSAFSPYTDSPSSPAPYSAVSAAYRVMQRYGYKRNAELYKDREIDFLKDTRRARTHQTKSLCNLHLSLPTQLLSTLPQSSRIIRIPRKQRRLMRRRKIIMILKMKSNPPTSKSLVLLSVKTPHRYAVGYHPNPCWLLLIYTSRSTTLQRSIRLSQIDCVQILMMTLHHLSFTRLWVSNNSWEAPSMRVLRLLHRCTYDLKRISARLHSPLRRIEIARSQPHQKRPQHLKQQ